MAADLYEILQVPRTATQEEIKSSYRRLARQYHPDVNPNDPTAEDKFKEIGMAYEILSDPEKRARYDQFGTTDDQSGPFFGGAQAGGIQDIFDMFFGGGGMGGSRRSRGQDGADLETRVTLTLLDVLNGLETTLTVRRAQACKDCKGTGGADGKEPEVCSACRGEGVTWRVMSSFLGQMRTSVTCSKCHGSGKVITNPCKTCNGRRQVVNKVDIKVKIPPGVEHGATMQLSGEGHEGLDGGMNGDLLVRLLIAEDSRFEREGKELYTVKEVTFAQAALGATLEIEGLDLDYDLDMPAGTQPGELLTIKGAGLPPLHGGKRGDLHVQVRLNVPKKLSQEQRNALVAYAQSMGETLERQESGGFLGFLKGKR